MTTELRLLVASVVLGLIHVIASSHLISWQRGYRWTAGNREGDARPLRGVANRVDQATTNFLETFPFFVALHLPELELLFCNLRIELQDNWQFFKKQPDVGK